MQQVAVCAVNFDDVESGFERPVGGGLECAHEFDNFFLRQLMRHRIAFTFGYGAGPDCFPGGLRALVALVGCSAVPWPLATGTAAGVPDLYAACGTACVVHRDDSFIAIYLTVIPDAGAAMGYASIA